MLSRQSVKKITERLKNQTFEDMRTYLCPRRVAYSFWTVRPSVIPSQNFNFVYKMYTLRRIFLKLGMHVAYDEFYFLSKVKVTEVMAAAGT